MQYKKIIFLAYDNRSGSTLLSSYLDSIPGIIALTESSFLKSIQYGKKVFHNKNELYLFLKNKLLNDDKFMSWKITNNEILKVTDGHFPLSGVDLFNKVLSIYVKHSENANDLECILYKGVERQYLSDVLSNFPNSLILYIIRDGRAVYSSKRRTKVSYSGRYMCENPIIASKIWNSWQKKIAVLPVEKIMIVKYEELIKNVRLEMKRIVDFLGLNAHTDFINIHNTNYLSKLSSGEIPLHVNLNKGPIKKRISAWQEELPFYEGYLFEFFSKKQLLKNGYDLYYTKKSISFAKKRIIYIKLLRYLFDYQYIKNKFCDFISKK